MAYNESKIRTYRLTMRGSLTRGPLKVPTGVCEKNTPREKNTHWNVSVQSTKSGAGLQFLLWDCRAEACAKGIICSQAPV